MRESDTAVLLINLGTPRSPTPGDVADYLREFLLDPEVIDIPWLPRQLLVRGVIAPFRSRSSARLYQKIWRPEGSPLLIYLQALTKALRKELPQIPIECACRYGEPSIQKALEKLQATGRKNLIILPLYPQYATSATRTTQTFLRDLKVHERFGRVDFISSFHDLDFYLASEEDLIRRHRPANSHVLFSFHSLPVRQIEKNHAGCAECRQGPHCRTQGDPLCYRRQCQETAEALATRLGLQPKDWSLSFQSRLGREEWLTPPTDKILVELAQKGIRNLTVVVAGFTADCLETLEELDHAGRDSFLAAGGSQWTRVPCLNDDPVWVKQLSQWILQKTSEENHGKTPSQPQL